MKYLHQVSYLRLKDVINVCISYCCLSGTTPGIISAFARCNWCVPIILLSIGCNVSACRSPVYHYIAATVVFLVQRIIPACVVVIIFYKDITELVSF